MCLLHFSGVSQRTGDTYPAVVSLTADNAFEGNRQVGVQEILHRAGVEEHGPVWLTALRAMFSALEQSLQRDKHTCKDRLKLIGLYLVRCSVLNALGPFVRNPRVLEANVFARTL
jgi:hypothetical protein